MLLALSQREGRDNSEVSSEQTNKHNSSGMAAWLMNDLASLASISQVQMCSDICKQCERQLVQLMHTH